MTQLDNPVRVDRVRKDGDSINFYSAPLQYPVLRMSKWQWGELVPAGIDPNTLDADDHFCQLLVHWQLSDKLNANGNPYRDIVRVEAISGSDRILTAVLDELRQIRALLQGDPATAVPQQPPAELRPGVEVDVRGNAGVKRGILEELRDGLVTVNVGGKSYTVKKDRISLAEELFGGLDGK